MEANQAVVHNESKEKRSHRYVKKTAVQLTVKCRIEKFEAVINSADFVGSLPGYACGCVSSELMPRANWILKVGKYEDDIDISLDLTGPTVAKSEEDDSSDETLSATYHLYLINGTDGKIDSIDGGTCEFGYNSDQFEGIFVGNDRVRRALHADGSLVVAADIEFLTLDDSARDVDLQQWPAKFSEFYGDATTSDCAIQVGSPSPPVFILCSAGLQIGDVTMPAHKLLLMACSPVFRTMFTSPASEESKSGIVKVTDFQRPEPMRAVIRYCYQGHLDAETMDAEWAVEIFQLAEKYCIDDLKALMEKHFINKRLSRENVIEMAVLADTHSAGKLKEACIRLIGRLGDTIFEGADWKELKVADPELAAELAEAATAEG